MGDSVLMMAARNGNVEAVEFFVESGADVTYRSLSGESIWDLIEGDPAFMGTKIYWRINDLRFE